MYSYCCTRYWRDRVMMKLVISGLSVSSCSPCSLGIRHSPPVPRIRHRTSSNALERVRLIWHLATGRVYHLQQRSIDIPFLIYRPVLPSRKIQNDKHDLKSWAAHWVTMGDCICSINQLLFLYINFFWDRNLVGSQNSPNAEGPLPTKKSCPSFFNAINLWNVAGKQICVSHIQYQYHGYYSIPPYYLNSATW